MTKYVLVMTDSGDTLLGRTNVEMISSSDGGQIILLENVFKVINLMMPRDGSVTMVTKLVPLPFSGGPTPRVRANVSYWWPVSDEMFEKYISNEIDEASSPERGSIPPPSPPSRDQNRLIVVPQVRPGR